MTQSIALPAALRRALLLSLCCAAIACGEGASSGAALLQPTPRSTGSASVTRLRATMDVATGTLTFTPVSPTGSSLAGSGISAAIYGDQGINVRLYNSAVVTSAPVGGKKTFSADVGVRNLLAYRVGDEQGAVAPADTMGVYVFMNTPPFVTGTSSPCSCSITVKNPQGTLSFTAANQTYWYWPEIIGAYNGGADTTRARRSWVFEADTQVTHFSFDVLVSAAWPTPNDTTWRVEYPADSLPDTQAEPRWRKLGGGTASATLVGGHLALTNPAATDSSFYYRGDSITTGMNALLEARFRLDNGGLRAKPQAGIVIDDGVKMIGVFMSDSGKGSSRTIGFVKSTGGAAFIGTAGTLDTLVSLTSRTIQVRKYRADSAIVYIDGVRRLSIAYASLPATRGTASFMFGARSPGGSGNTSTWEDVVYQIGRATP